MKTRQDKSPIPPPSSLHLARRIVGDFLTKLLFLSLWRSLPGLQTAFIASNVSEYWPQIWSSTMFKRRTRVRNTTDGTKEGPQYWSMLSGSFRMQNGTSKICEVCHNTAWNS